ERALEEAIVVLRLPGETAASAPPADEVENPVHGAVPGAHLLSERGDRVLIPEVAGLDLCTQGAQLLELAGIATDGDHTGSGAAQGARRRMTAGARGAGDEHQAVSHRFRGCRRWTRSRV